MTRIRRTWWVLLCIASLSTYSIASRAAIEAQPRPTLDWQQTIEDAKRLASQSNRMVLLHFTSPGCEACQVLERDVFTNPRVQQQIQTRFVPFKINTDDHPTTAKKHGIDRIPMQLVIDPGAKSVILGRMQCPTTVDAYLNELAGIVPSPQAIASAKQPVAGAAALTASTAVHANNQPFPNSQPSIADPAQDPFTAAQSGTTPHPTGPETSNWQAHSPQGSQPQNTVNPHAGDRYAEVYRQMGAAPPDATQPSAAVVQPSHANPQTANVAQPSVSQPSWGTAGYLASNQPAAGAIVVAPSPAATQIGAARPSPIGLEGYCPVTLAEKKVWQVGDRRWGAVHRGRTYLFAGPMEQKEFLSNPDRYSPAISGWDVVAAIDHGQTIDGQRQFGVTYQNRIYLFSNAASRQAFQQNPTRYAAEVLQAENPTRGTTLR